MYSFIKKLYYTFIYKKYKDFTMIPANTYAGNLALAKAFKNIKGSVVECGVWRGGMIAGMSEILGKDRNYYLFDSFEGLPKAQEIDGKAAKAWQSDTTGSFYHDNCKAEMFFAEQAMKLSKTPDYQLIKGWFHETLPQFISKKPIAVLRLDGDWYDSTLECLKHLFPLVAENGLVIIDDYFMWDGCTLAVHDYLSVNKLPYRIRTSPDGICYIIKQENCYEVAHNAE